jgi:uncharacterized protein (TIGR00369 family)
MTEFGADVQKFVQAHIDEHGFLSWLGMSVENIDPGHIVMRVPYDERLTNPIQTGQGGRTMHGGVASTLIDTAGGMAVHSTIPNPLETGIATIDLNVSYLRPATADLLVTADIVRVGRSIGVSTVTVVSTTDHGEQDEVAVGNGSYRVFRDDD